MEDIVILGTTAETKTFDINGLTVKGGASASYKAVAGILNTSASYECAYAIELLSANDKSDLGLGRMDEHLVAVSIRILRYSGMVPATYYDSLATTKDDDKGITKHLSAQLVAPLAQFNVTVTRTPDVKNAINKTEIFG